MDKFLFINSNAGSPESDGTARKRLYKDVTNRTGNRKIPLRESERTNLNPLFGCSKWLLFARACTNRIAAKAAIFLIVFALAGFGQIQASDITAR